MRWTTWPLPFAMAEQTSLLACKIQVTNPKRFIVCNHRLIRQIKVTTPSVALQEMSQESYIWSHQEILSFGLRFFNGWILKNIIKNKWRLKFKVIKDCFVSGARSLTKEFIWLWPAVWCMAMVAISTSAMKGWVLEAIGSGNVYLALELSKIFLIPHVENRTINTW